ncbi:MAG: hypothetical protein FVQ82_09790 [Planctomycetes bacterium]|nr:hypothetical protein [Planctomycetota bacterium]
MLTRNNVLAVLLVVVSLMAMPIYATQIDPLTWEQMTVSCDFAGIVECTTAGGIVAEYKVVEAWKGTEHIEPIRIRVATNYWEPQFPLALIGEQYLVFAYKNNAPSRMVSTTIGGPVPLWWRNIPYDYRLPLFQGRYKPDSNQQLSAYDLSHSGDTSKKITIDEFKKQVKQLTGKSKKDQEVVILRILFKKYYLDRPSQRHKSDMKSFERHKPRYERENPEMIKHYEDKAKGFENAAGDLAQLSKLVTSEDNPIQIIDKIFDFTIAHTYYENSFDPIIMHAILTPESLKHFKKRLSNFKSSNTDLSEYNEIKKQTHEFAEKIAAKSSDPEKPADPSLKKQMDSYYKQLREHKGKPYYDLVRDGEMVTRSLEKRINGLTGQSEAPKTPAKTYTSKELDEHQKILTDSKNFGNYKWSKSFNILIDYRPVYVAKWLKKWKNPKRRWSDEHMGYSLGSSAACRFKKDKIKCLEILLGAKNRYIRSAAAVYLALEDEQKGIKKLKKMAKLKGDPGLWASLNLARRGSKDYMDDVIKEVSDYPYRDGSGMVQVPHRNLLKRAEVLLSNSAAKSNIPKPPTVTHLRKHSTSDEIKIQKAVNDLQVWWAKNRKQIKLHDPWLETLKKQKVD